MAYRDMKEEEQGPQVDDSEILGHAKTDFEVDAAQFAALAEDCAYVKSPI